MIGLTADDLRQIGDQLRTASEEEAATMARMLLHFKRAEDIATAKSPGPITLKWTLATEPRENGLKNVG